MKECKDIDPVRTDRVSVWIYTRDESEVTNNISYHMVLNI